MDGRHLQRKRRRTLISCTECHRRKQKCDRQTPCQNCLKRCKPEICRYKNDHGNPPDSLAAQARGASSSSTGPSPPSMHSQLVSKGHSLSSQDHKHLVSTLGYSTHNAHTTFSLVNLVGSTASSVPCPPNAVDRRQTALNNKYRALIRQLPPKDYIDILVHQFFSELNWQYDVLDEIAFHRQLEAWRCYPYSAQSNLAESLPVDILAFPSLLSQVVAFALIYQPAGEQAGSSLESLKYASEITFLDLAHEISEAGHAVVEMIRKTKLSLVAVQAGILRASFLKNTASVVEAWHVVGATLRNAQEIGVHTDAAGTNPTLSADAQWDHEMGRRVWFVLHNWDIHMAVVLGRPIATTTMTGLPDDLAQRECGKPPEKRTYQDAPTPFSVIRIGYEVAYRYFPRIRELENSGARSEDYHVVRQTQAAIVGNITQIPTWCRHDDPDLRFDGSPKCNWLAGARQSLASGIYFVLLSLHRPYIFSVQESRTEALKAARMILTSQRQLYQLSEAKQHLAFNMVYPMFDAVVISLAILVLFPAEHSVVRSGLVEELHWSTDIFANVGHQSSIGQSANGVLKTLLSRLEGVHKRGSLQHSKYCGEERAIESLWSGTADVSALEINFDTAMPTYNLDVGDLLPPRPVGDLFYRDIFAQGNLQGADVSSDSVQFEGNYPDDSFWNFMNDFGHL